MYELVAVGASWGGLRALGALLDRLPHTLCAPVVIAQHRSPDSAPGTLERLLQGHTPFPVHEALDKEPLEANHVYVAPADYHLLVERGSLALSLEGRVSYARPSLDVLFESAADAYGAATIGIVLTGANEDGARGLARIKQAGGVAIVEDPRTAERPEMPAAALAATVADAVLPVGQIGGFLHGLVCEPAQRQAAAS